MTRWKLSGSGSRSGYWIAAGCAALLAGGCASRTELEPAASANEVPALPQAAAGQAAGVHIIAQAPEEWPGEADVAEKVEPMRVIIENGGDQPLFIRYRDFRLVGPQGATYRALPPFKIGGPAESPALQGDYAAIPDPAIVSQDFGIDPAYGPLYPGLPLAADPVVDDPLFYDRYYSSLMEVNLPTPEMLRYALPEGELLPGGRVEGYLYFEKVDEDVPSVTFRADLVGAAGEERLGAIDIPFDVEGG